MGVSGAELFCLGQILLSSPATDDPIVVIIAAMVISGTVMLVFGGLSLAAKIRRARKAEKYRRK